MNNPYRARVDTRAFLNLAGIHDGAYVFAYVEDTSERGLECSEYDERLSNVHPRIILEIADCSERINLSFEIYSALRRKNSFQKIDTLIEALTEFRAGLVEECTVYRRRERELAEQEAEHKAKKGDKR
jgi:hypothetical protein